MANRNDFDKSFYPDAYRLDNWSVDEAILMTPGQWYLESGGVVLEPRRLRITATGASFAFPHKFHVRYDLRCVDLTAVSATLKNASNNGYKISFPTDASIKLERLDAGSGTEIVTVDTTSLALGDDIRFVLDLWRYPNGGIVLQLNGTTVINTVEATYFGTDSVPMKWYWTSSGILYIYLFRGDLYRLYTGREEYQRSLVQQDEYALGTSALKVPEFVFTNEFKMELNKPLLPEKGYYLEFNMLNSGGYQKLKVGLTTPDRVRGIYVEFFNDGAKNTVRICTADGTVRATSSSTVNVQSFRIYVDSATYAANYISITGLTGSPPTPWVDYSAGATYLSRNMVLWIEGAETAKTSFWLYGVACTIDGTDLQNVNDFGVITTETNGQIDISQRKIVTPY